MGLGLAVQTNFSLAVLFHCTQYIFIHQHAMQEYKCQVEWREEATECTLLCLIRYESLHASCVALNHVCSSMCVAYLLSICIRHQYRSDTSRETWRKCRPYSTLHTYLTLDLLLCFHSHRIWCRKLCCYGTC